jgi:hypothetical protein
LPLLLKALRVPRRSVSRKPGGHFLKDVRPDATLKARLTRGGADKSNGCDVSAEPFSRKSKGKSKKAKEKRAEGVALINRRA